MYLFDDRFDSIEAKVGGCARGLIQVMIEGKSDETWCQPRCGRRLKLSDDENNETIADQPPSDGPRSQCRAPGCLARAAGPRNRRAKCCGPIYAATSEEIERSRKAFIRKRRLRHRPVVDCLEEAGDRLFSVMRLPPRQWRSVRTTNAIERLHEEFKRESRRRPCCRRLIPQRCCSGRNSLPVRSTYARLTVARCFPPNHRPVDLAARPDTLEMLELAANQNSTQNAIVRKLCDYA